MRDPDAFDRCYAESRSRLLHQTFALTGDLQASRSAVRDAFVAAWHHWGKVGRLADPEDWIRPRAWRLAQRRHTGRIWHRDRALDPEARATLDALGKLSVSERKALLLTQLSAAPLPEIARELGLPLAMAERKLQSATAHFTTQRDVTASAIRPLLDQLQVHVDSHRWPRATIVRRSGATRRRTHTAVGAVAMVALLVASGAVVTDAGGVRPGLHREATTEAAASPRSSATTAEPSASPSSLAEVFSPDQLLTARQLGGLVPGRRWHAVKTSDNSRGDGLALPCQTQRYADPKAVGALTRSFASTPPHRPPLAGVELVELSDSARAARRTYATTVDWFAGCTDDRVQLMETRRVTGVGDAATAFVLRDWDDDGATIVAQVSRTGVATTSVATTLPAAVPMDRALEVLSDAVNGVCNLPGGGRCAGGAASETIPPLPAGTAPGMLGEFDLPPVATVRLPWVGTDPHRAMHNLAATGCDSTSFHQRGMKRNMTRSFVVPGSRLPEVFGLTQSVARLPERGAAAAVVAGVRKDLSTCPDRKLGTKVSRLAETASGPQEMAVWHITTEISDQQSVTYLMGIARNGDAVTQVGFVPSGKATMTPEAFVALMRRAQVRLDTLP